MANELTTINDYCDISKTSLKFKCEVTKDQWAKVFSGLKTIEGCVQFWIGDCLKYREQKWGMYEDVAEESGIEVNTLRQYKQVADQVKSDTRVSDLGYSHHREVAALDEKQQEEYLQKAVENDWTVKELRDAIKEDKYSALPAIKVPVGKYSIIYADPPWRYFEDGDKNQSKHYRTMAIEDIINLPIQDISDDNCILFLWVTFPMLQESFKVIESWGFEYSTCGFTWVKLNKKNGKPFFGLGSWTRSNAELCLIATKGSIKRLDASISQVIMTPIEEHSKKPDIIREKIVQLVGDLPRVELFARNKTEGWDVWGNEV